jgi:hypothetical protein
VKFFSVGAELGSVRSVFDEVHCAAFDVFVFASKRLGEVRQLGMFGCNIVPIIHEVIFAGGFVNAGIMPRRANRSRRRRSGPPRGTGTSEERPARRDLQSAERERQAGCLSRRSTFGISRYARHECGRK